MLASAPGQRWRPSVASGETDCLRVQLYCTAMSIARDVSRRVRPRMGTPPSSVILSEGGLLPAFYAPQGGSPQLKTPATPAEDASPRTKTPTLSDPNASTAAANASVVVPHVTLATAALAVARVQNLSCGVQLARHPPSTLPLPPCC